MPIECLVVWIIASHDDREETTVQEELIQEGKKIRGKKMEEKRKQTKERAQKKGKECGTAPTQKGQRNRLLRRRARLLPRETKTLRRTIRRHQWFIICRSGAP
jgi:hypothetical protein